MARSKSKGKVTADGKYAFGTGAEVDQRAKTGYQNPPSNFRQPGDARTGRSVNEVSGPDVGGSYKFDRP